VQKSEMPLMEAARYLGISRSKMWTMVKNNIIPYKKDPLDNRKKLIKVSDLDELRTASTNNN
jgi:excisionase family DNA binding protein